MAQKTIAPFDELVKLASDFVTKQKGIWDHSAWSDFISSAQKQGVDLSEEMQSYLGEVLEAMKRFYAAAASTKGIEKAMTKITRDSAAFINDQKGVWGHAEWEAFTKGVQKNTMSLSEETTSYLGGLLESMKAFYSISPPPAPAKKTTAKRSAAKAAKKPANRASKAKTT